MKKTSLLSLLSCILLFSSSVSAQGLISQTKNTPTSSFPECGTYHLMENINEKSQNYLELSDQLMERLTRMVKQQKQSKSNNNLYTIPVVFHVVYNNNQENIPDSVILNQLNILNECFRRQNADTSNTRVSFQSLVDDSHIEFRLANVDPAGNPTTGITRTNTNVTHFGGVLPYGPGQNQQIANWVNDSLYYNYFRLTKDSLGGKSAWDTARYLNIWMGDLRILEPQFGNFEELVFFALATPPSDHANWPDSVLNAVNIYNQGVLLHYVNVGSNNPNSLPPPYQSFNGVVTNGKILVHEVGHYLGLRHIWGDGDCSVGDHIDDTPNSHASSGWICNLNANTCTDTINNMDLFNMVENYMDYSGGNCQNSFTKGQINVMRAALRQHRPLLMDTMITSISDEYNIRTSRLKLFPNPTNGDLSVDLSSFSGKVRLHILNSVGKLMLDQEFENEKLVRLNLEVPAGIYFLKASYGRNTVISSKFVVQ